MIELKNVVKKYFVGQENELTVLRDISLKIDEGDFVAIVGQSGSGKSTIMNILGALDRPTEGEYILDGTVISHSEVDKKGRVKKTRGKNTVTDNDLSNIRNKKIGFVFQNFNLIPRQNALMNVELPMFYLGLSKSKRRTRAKELLKLVEMEERMHHQPNELSGGQKQRVAIARSLANDPAIILADEPTGALDSKTGTLVMDLFLRINEQEKKTVILITHNDELARQACRVITLADGVIIGDERLRHIAI